MTSKKTTDEEDLKEYVPEPQDDVVRNDLPDNDPGTEGIDPDEQGGDLPHTLEQ